MSSAPRSSGSILPPSAPRGPNTDLNGSTNSFSTPARVPRSVHDCTETFSRILKTPTLDGPPKSLSLWYKISSVGLLILAIVALILSVGAAVYFRLHMR